MSKNLMGKVAVVTGSGQGIGRAIAMELAEEGASVVTNNRRPGSTGFAFMNEQLLKKLSKEKRDWLTKQSTEAAGDAETTAKVIREKSGVAVPFFGDVSNFNVAGDLIKTAVDNFGKIDILVNVIGTFRFSPVWEMSEQTWDYVTSVKPKAYFNCIRHALPFMIEQKWGRIINCSSEAWKGGGLRQVNYSAASAGVLGLTFGVAKEVAEFGITCNAFAPFATTRATFELDAYEEAVPKEKNPHMDGLSSKAAKISWPFPGPEEIAPFICYLASEKAADINCRFFTLLGSEIGIYPEMDPNRHITKYCGKWTFDELVNEVPKLLL